MGNDKLRTLFLLETSCIGGIEQQALTILKHLDPDTFEKHVIITDIDWMLGEQFKEHSDKYTSLDTIEGAWNDISTPSPNKLSIIMKYIQDNEIDVVHLFNGIQYIFAIPVDIQLVLTLGGDYNRSEYFSRVNLPDADPVDAVKSNLAQRKKLTIISDNPDNRNIFGNDIVITASAIESMSLEGDRRDKRIVWVGRNSPEKRPELVIELASRLRDHQFIMIMSDFNSPLPPDWDDLPNVSIYRNITDKEYLMKMYRSSDIYLLTSKTEGFPNTLPEAMSQGCYPICSVVGNITSDSVPDGTLLELPTTVDDYVRAVRGWDRKRKNNKNQIRKRILKHSEQFNITHTIAELEKIYRKEQPTPTTAPITPTTRHTTIHEEPGKKMAVVIDSVHQNILAKQLGIPVILYGYAEILEYDTILFMGMYHSSKADKLVKIKKLKPDIKIILWWIGSDVYFALTEESYNVQLVNELVDLHLCVSPELKSELKSIGIEAEELCLVPDGNFYPLPFPEEYTVGVCMIKENEFYMYNDIARIIKATPEIKYLVYGNQSELSLGDNDNVELCGWVDDTREILKRCSCLLRLTQHDGFPKSVIEAARMKRCVITNHDFPKLFHSTDIDEIIEKIKTKPLIEFGVDGWYSQHYSSDSIRDRFSERNIIIPQNPGTDNGVATHIETFKKHSQYNVEVGKCVLGKVINTHAQSREAGDIDVYTAHSYYTVDDYDTITANDMVTEPAYKAKRIICVSNYVKDFLINQGIDEAKMTVIPNPVDIVEMDMVEPSTKFKELPKKFALFIGDKKVKRPELFVKLARRNPRDKFVVIGCTGMKLPKNVIRLEHMTRADALKVMLRSNMFLLLSKRESCPYVLLEAMALGKTCIASDYAGQQEIIKDGHNGFLFYPDDIDSLQKAYKRAKKKSAVGRNARVDIERLYDARIIVPKMDSVYTQPKVSVVTFVYCTKENNRLRMLKECIASVSRQNFKSYEHIIVDDGSTVDLHSEILKMNDPHLKYYWKGHTGILDCTEPFNYGLMMAQGEYVIILASDDLQLRALEPLSAYLDENPDWVAVVGTHMREKGVIWPHKFDLPVYDALLLGNCVHGDAIMFRRTVLDKIELPTNETGFAGDYDMWLKISEVGMIGKVDNVVVLYRTHSDSTRTTTNTDVDYRTERIEFVIDSAKRRRGMI